MSRKGCKEYRTGERGFFLIGRGYNMKFKKSCKTCAFNYNGICTNHLYINEIGYANKINDIFSPRHCWLISIPTTVSLINRLTRLERKLISKASYISSNDLIFRIENGYWPPKYKLFYSLNNYLLKRRGMKRIKIIS